MKLTVFYRHNFGKDLFYPADEWTARFISALKPASKKQVALSKNQALQLKELGFELEVLQEDKTHILD